MNDFVSKVREVIPDFSPSDNDIYTFRYVFKLKGKDSVNFIHLSGLVETHFEQYERILNSLNIESCLIEYLGQFDSRFVGSVIHLKDKKMEVDDNEKICD